MINRNNLFGYVVTLALIIAIISLWVTLSISNYRLQVLQCSETNTAWCMSHPDGR